MPIRKRGPWWHYRFQLNGSEYAGSTKLPATEANRRGAERYEKEERKRILAGQVRETRKDFATAAGEFVTWCKDVEYRQKPNSAGRIKTSFTSLVSFFGEMAVAEIGAAELERFKLFRVQVNGVRDITLRHDLHALSVFFQYAERMRWRTGNPVRQVKIPSDAEAVRINPIDTETERKYFKAAAGNKNLYDVGRLILNQGCRPEEIMAARKEDLNLKAGMLHIPGGKSKAARRTLHLTPESLSILKARLRTPGIWLFPSDRHKGRHLTKLNGTHDRACIAAGVSFVLYDLRHSFGTRHATEQKTDPFTLAAIMGHANLRTIMRYVHPDQNAQRAAMQRYAAAQQRGKLRRIS